MALVDDDQRVLWKVIEQRGWRVTWGAPGEVTLELEAVNQRDETIARGEALVILPRRATA